MVFVLGLAAAAFLGAGWVLQQRVATSSKSSDLLSWSVMTQLVRSPLWWVGIAIMAAGQSLSAWALQLGAVSTVEPVLVMCLLFAFIISAIAAHQWPRWQELLGPIVLCAALSVFLEVSDPRVNRHTDPGWRSITIAIGAASLVAAALTLAGATVGRRSTKIVECALFGAAAGVMYGVQDAATRGAIVAVDHHNVVFMASTMWPWVVLGTATAGVLLSQSAFRAERLDYALPPTAAVQPIAGILLGVILLRDRLAAGGADLTLEMLCLVGMLVGVVLIGRAPMFS